MTAYQEFYDQFGGLFPNGLPRKAAGAFLAFDHDWMPPRPSDTLDGLGLPLQAHPHDLHRSLSRRRLACCGSWNSGSQITDQIQRPVVRSLLVSRRGTQAWSDLIGDALSRGQEIAAA